MIITGTELQEKIEAGRYATFTLPVLDITIKYRKPDLLKLSLSNSLPAALADAVIESYRSLANGATQEELQSKLKDRKEVSDDFIEELSTKSYDLLGKLCVSHKIWDVEQSDPDNGLISWNDVPEEDAMAFLINLINEAQKSRTASGGETSFEEVQTFPDSPRGKKRAVASKSR